MALHKSENSGQVKAGKAREQAEALAIKALGFLAADEELLGDFMGQAGLSPDSLRDAAKSRNFLNFVMDFICSNDTLIVNFASAEHIRPEAVMTARHHLEERRSLESHE